MIKLRLSQLVTLRILSYLQPGYSHLSLLITQNMSKLLSPRCLWCFLLVRL